MNEREVTTAKLLRYMQEFLPMKQDLQAFATREDLQVMTEQILRRQGLLRMTAGANKA